MRVFRTILCSLIVFTFAGSAFAANQLLNPDFATNLVGWTGFGPWPPVWDGSQGDAALGALREDAVAGGATGAGVVNQCTSATAGGTYDFGVSFLINVATSTQTGGARVRVTWFDGLGCTGTATTDPSSADATAAAGWQHLAVNNVVAPAGTQSVLLETIQSIDGAGTLSGFWDDAYFGPDPTPVELVSFVAE